MNDYEMAMMHVELALRRASAKLRTGGETSIEDALWALADQIATFSEEARKAAHASALREGQS